MCKLLASDNSKFRFNIINWIRKYMTKDFYMDHFDSCDYCSELYDSNRPDKDELIEKHTIDAYADACDRAYEQHKDREMRYNPTLEIIKLTK